jgi:RNA polymerase sigma-70 factor, ECF subfamily
METTATDSRAKIVNPALQLEPRTGSPGRRFRRRHTSLQARQEQALQELLLTSRERFVRVANRILQNKEDAEDAVQDAFLSACVHFDKFEGRSAITTWLTRIVMNSALMIRRRRKNIELGSFHDLTADDTTLVERMPDPQPDPELAYAQSESFEFLDSILQRMNPLFREALTMTYYDELSTSKASSTLDIPISTYKARLLRGRYLLQERARKRLKAPRLLREK